MQPGYVTVHYVTPRKLAAVKLKSKVVVILIHVGLVRVFGVGAFVPTWLLTAVHISSRTDFYLSGKHTRCLP